MVYATDQGLGVLARSFYRAGLLTDVLVLVHPSRPTHFEWYPGAARARTADCSAARRFVRSMDAVLFLETPFHWPLVPLCRRSALMPMHECTPYPLPAEPDIVLCPSSLEAKLHPRGARVQVPVDVPYRLRSRAELFVHNAGNGGLRGRNGTREVLEAVRLARSPARFLVRSQVPLRGAPGRAEVRVGTFPYSSLYSEGDAFLFPDKFSGLSLPLQEARAAGMLVLTVDREPFRGQLPREQLVPAAGFRTARLSAATPEFEEAELEPEALAAAVDSWYGRDVSEASRAGAAWARSASWGALLPAYRRLLLP